MQTHIQKAMAEIFASMVMMEIDVSEIDLDLDAPLKESLTAIIGFSGTTKGLVALHMPKSVALAITSSFLMMEVNDINEDVKDAIGELTNMISGEVKNKLISNGWTVDLSIPTTISGDSYDFRCGSDTERLLTSFKIGAGIFTVDLQLQG